MLERIFIATALILVAGGLFILFRHLHGRRVELALATSGPSLLYFRSDNCAPCLTQARQLEALPLEMRRRIQIQVVDADQDQTLPAQFGIFTLPTTLLVDGNGKVRHVNYGLADAQKLTHQLESVL